MATKSIKETLMDAANASGEVSGTPHGQSGSRAQRRRKTRRAPSVGTAASSPGKASGNTTTLKKRVPSRGAANPAVRAFARSASQKAKTTPIKPRPAQQAQQRAHEVSQNTKLMAQTYKEGNEGRLSPSEEAALARSRMWVAKGKGSGNKLVQRTVQLAAGAEGGATAAPGAARGRALKAARGFPPDREPIDADAYNVQSERKARATGRGTGGVSRELREMRALGRGVGLPATPKKARAGRGTPSKKNFVTAVGQFQRGKTNQERGVRRSSGGRLLRDPATDAGSTVSITHRTTTMGRNSGIVQADRAPRNARANTQSDAQVGAVPRGKSGAVQLTKLAGGTTFGSGDDAVEWDAKARAFKKVRRLTPAQANSAVTVGAEPKVAGQTRGLPTLPGGKLREVVAPNSVRTNVSQSSRRDKDSVSSKRGSTGRGHTSSGYKGGTSKARKDRDRATTGQKARKKVSTRSKTSKYSR